ncbi:heme biosynthesis protein HemY [Rhodoligotrophos defluvii]|uniref:heme biosynthesis protein HemY n=1 Tax=Rhodoligotrophos defluvii TaxID=2561934 RepID=UPI0010C9C748|nr:heme biosynthesis HemY N-terminal domain-containing protein [Rhodoligotrophos defluvii]
MWPIIFRFIIIALIAAGIAWLADRPGTLNIVWLGYHIQMPMIAAVFCLLALMAAIALLWSLLRRLVFAPAAVSDFFGHRRRRKGHRALSRGIIAIGAGDLHGAQRQAQIAARNLPDEPLVKLLQAQTAQLEGNATSVRQIFEGMLRNRETELLGLRGLFNQARQAGNLAEARRLAERAARIKPDLPWASNAMLAVHSAQQDWPGVVTLIENQRRAGLISTAEAQRKRAVAETAEAMALEPSNEDEALRLATKAHKDAPELVPAVLVAARLLAQRGSVRKAMRMIEKTWGYNPHRDLAEAYAHVRPGDSAQDRLRRVRLLIGQKAGGEEGAVALARAAIEARDFGSAREALAPYLDHHPSAGICLLMAEIERLEHDDRGKEREWLARAVSAPRDPAWTADGHVSEVWLPVSPVTGELDAFVWKRPVEGIGPTLPAEEAAARPAEAIEHSPSEEAASAASPTATAGASSPPPAPADPGRPEPATEERPAKSVVVAAVPSPASAVVPPPVVIPYPDLGELTPEVVAKGQSGMEKQPDDPGPEPDGETDADEKRQPEWLGSTLPR